MPVTVIVGGQFGSEGKGKVSKCLAETMGASIAIRCGGPNSGHTAIDELGRVNVFRQLPTACLLPEIICVLVAGSYIDLEVLYEELKIVNLDSNRLIIDPNAIIITEQMKREEEKSGLPVSIGSTASGTGVAVRQRIDRKNKLLFAKDILELKHYIKNTKTILREALNRNERVVIEGTQGYGLSLLHSEYYPYVTARDTTAAAFVSEAGLSPLDVDDVVLVIRAFPIRVSGNSGPLRYEVDWNIVTRESGSLEPIVEYTSVTKSLRRVGRFDERVIIQAIEANSPTRIVLNHLDYIDKVEDENTILSNKMNYFISKVEKLIKKRIDFVGFSPVDIRDRYPLAVIRGISKDV